MQHPVTLANKLVFRGRSIKICLRVKCSFPLYSLLPVGSWQLGTSEARQCTPATAHCSQDQPNPIDLFEVPKAMSAKSCSKQMYYMGKNLF